MNGKQITLSVVGFFGAVLALTWVSTGNDFFLYKVFAPQQEKVRRQVFEQTPSYVQGMVRELENMQFAYVQANPEQKAALATTILQRAAGFDLNQAEVHSELRQFVEQLRREKAAAR